MRIKIYTEALFLFVFILVGTIVAQAQYTKPEVHIHDFRCGTMPIDTFSRGRYPERGTLEEFERWLAPKVDEYKRQAANGSRLPILTIPVVFHVITGGTGATNVSAAIIQAQVDQLNIDYRNLAGSSNGVAADTEIEFCLATLDPSNNIMAEPGIHRVTTYGAGPFSDATIDGTIKPATSWDPNSYMNIWSANISGGLLGWAQFPDASGLGGMPGGAGGAANTDGVVALHSSLGSVANPNPAGGAYARGRTMTHEVGHWLGLRHIWGDGNCGVDDFCGDTPLSDAANYGCPNTNSCTDPAPNPRDMVENYMDYTDDACMDIFTANQKARMRTVMANCTRRASLASSTKCGVPTPMIAFAAGGAVTMNEGTDCSYQDFVVNVTISMAPSATATVTFNSTGLTTGTLGQDYEFFPASVTFPAGSTPTRQVTIRIYNDGLVEANEKVELGFGVTTSGNAVTVTGDLATYDITIQDDDVSPAAGGLVYLINENFESGTLNGFTVLGNVGSDLYSVGNNTALSSTYWTTTGNTTQFAYTNDDRCNCNKGADRLTTPVFSLVGAYTTATLTFDHAFSANGTNEDGYVQISTGGAFTTIATLTNTSVATALMTTPWVNNYTVDLTPYIGQATVQVRFRYEDNGGWRYGLAVDNVRVGVDAPVNIQTADNTAVPRDVPVTGWATAHFYDVATKNVMGTIQNQSAWDYQCTRVEVDRDAATVGATTAPFWDATPGNALAAKTFFVSPNNNTPTGAYTITLYYTEAEIAAWEVATGKSRTALKIIKVSNNPISTITALNYTSYTIEQQTATIGAFGGDVTLTATFNSGFSGFGIGNPGPAPVVLLPMELLTFTGKRVNKSSALAWQTEHEVAVDYYILEKSTDGVTFEEINRQTAKGNGLKSATNLYNYTDNNAFVGFNYYRLAQVDMDGILTYSKTIAVDMNEEVAPVMTLSPNPARQDINVAYNSSTKATINIEIYDAIGNKMLSQANMSVEAGNNNILLNVRDYPAGMYILRVKQGSQAIAKRFIKK